MVQSIATPLAKTVMSQSIAMPLAKTVMSQSIVTLLTKTVMFQSTVTPLAKRVMFRISMIPAALYQATAIPALRSLARFRASPSSDILKKELIAQGAARFRHRRLLISWNIARVPLLAAFSP